MINHNNFLFMFSSIPFPYTSRLIIVNLPYQINPFIDGSYCAIVTSNDTNNEHAHYGQVVSNGTQLRIVRYSVGDTGGNYSSVFITGYLKE